MRSSIKDFLSQDLQTIAFSAGRWWWQELTLLIPPGIKRYFTESRDYLVFESVHDGFMLDYHRGSTTEKLGFVPIFLDRLGTIPALGKKSTSFPIAIWLPPEQILCRQFDLPLTNRRHLRELLSFELDSRTPLTMEQACFSYRVLARDPTNKRMRVEIQVTKRPLIESLRSIFVKSGYKPIWIGSKLDRPFTKNTNLLFPAPKYFFLPAHLLYQAVLAITAALFFSILIILKIDQISQNDNFIQNEVQKMRSQAEGVEALKHRVESLTAASQLLTGLRADQSFSRPIEELAKLLPDTCWLTGVSIDAKTIRVQGFAKSSAALIALIDGSPLFQNARFSSTVTKIPAMDMDRFELLADRSAKEGR